MILDVSKWQGKIDWKKVKTSNVGIEGVFVKVSEGIGYKDSTCDYNALEAFKMGFKIGYYHFASLNDHNEVNDAVKEAAYFLSLIKKLPKNTLPLILDLETNKAGLSKDEVLNWINTFFNELEKAGYNDYALYSYTPFLNANLPINHGLGNIKLWVAAYAPAPLIPKGWVKYWLWQYTSKGSIQGILTNVDLNKYYNT